MHTFEGDYAAVLAALRPRKVFEWGPGWSTRMALAAGAVVVAVEHDRRWVPQIAAPRGQFRCRLAALYSPEYVTVDADADVYFIDGRRRAECVNAVHTHAKPSAVVCLHDAQRERYHRALQGWEYVRFLSRGFAVASHFEGVVNLPREGER